MAEDITTPQNYPMVKIDGNNQPLKIDFDPAKFGYIPPTPRGTVERQAALHKYDFPEVGNTKPFGTPRADWRAEQQNGFKQLWSGVINESAKVVTGLLKYPGYVFGREALNMPTPEAMARALMYSSGYLEGIEGMEEDIDKGGIPFTDEIFTKRSVHEGDFYDKVTSSAWWATEGFNAVGTFAQFALVTRGMGALRPMTRLGPRVSRMVAKNKVVPSWVHKTGRGLDIAMISTTQAYIEGNMEAHEFVKSMDAEVRQQAEQAARNPYTGEVDKDRYDEIYEAGIAKVNAQVPQIITANMGLLLIPNMVLNNVLLRKMGLIRSPRSSIKVGKGQYAAPKPLSWKQKTANTLGDVAKFTTLEGLLEEGGQMAINNFHQEVARGNYRDPDIGTSFTDILNDVTDPEKWNNFGDYVQGLAVQYAKSLHLSEFQTAVFLGSLLGAGAGGIASGKQRRADQTQKGMAASLINSYIGGFTEEAATLFSKVENEDGSTTWQYNNVELAKHLRATAQEQVINEFAHALELAGQTDYSDHLFKTQIGRLALGYLHTFGSIDGFIEDMDSFREIIENNERAAGREIDARDIVDKSRVKATPESTFAKSHRQDYIDNWKEVGQKMVRHAAKAAKIVGETNITPKNKEQRKHMAQFLWTMENALANNFLEQELFQELKEKIEANIANLQLKLDTPTDTLSETEKSSLSKQLEDAKKFREAVQLELDTKIKEADSILNQEDLDDAFDKFAEDQDGQEKRREKHIKAMKNKVKTGLETGTLLDKFDLEKVVNRLQVPMTPDKSGKYGGKEVDNFKAETVLELKKLADLISGLSPVERTPQTISQFIKEATDSNGDPLFPNLAAFLDTVDDVTDFTDTLLDEMRLKSSKPPKPTEPGTNTDYVFKGNLAFTEIYGNTEKVAELAAKDPDIREKLTLRVTKGDWMEKGNVAKEGRLYSPLTANYQNMAGRYHVEILYTHEDGTQESLGALPHWNQFADMNGAVIDIGLLGETRYNEIFEPKKKKVTDDQGNTVYEITHGQSYAEMKSAQEASKRMWGAIEFIIKQQGVDVDSTDPSVPNSIEVPNSVLQDNVFINISPGFFNLVGKEDPKTPLKVFQDNGRLSVPLPDGPKMVIVDVQQNFEKENDDSTTATRELGDPEDKKNKPANRTLLYPSVITDLSQKDKENPALVAAIERLYKLYRNSADWHTDKPFSRYAVLVRDSATSPHFNSGGNPMYVGTTNKIEQSKSPHYSWVFIHPSQVGNEMEQLQSLLQDASKEIAALRKAGDPALHAKTTELNQRIRKALFVASDPGIDITFEITPKGYAHIEVYSRTSTAGYNRLKVDITDVVANAQSLDEFRQGIIAAWDKKVEIQRKAGFEALGNLPHIKDSLRSGIPEDMTDEAQLVERFSTLSKPEIKRNQRMTIEYRRGQNQAYPAPGVPTAPNKPKPAAPAAPAQDQGDVSGFDNTQQGEPDISAGEMDGGLSTNDMSNLIDNAGLAGGPPKQTAPPSTTAPTYTRDNNFGMHPMDWGFLLDDLLKAKYHLAVVNVLNNEALAGRIVEAQKDAILREMFEEGIYADKDSIIRGWKEAGTASEPKSESNQSEADAVIAMFKDKSVEEVADILRTPEGVKAAQDMHAIRQANRKNGDTSWYNANRATFALVAKASALNDKRGGGDNVPFSIGDNNTITSAAAEDLIDLAERRKNVEAILGSGLTVNELSEVASKLSNGNVVYGKLVGAAMYLNKIAPKGVEYHESFHYIFRALFTEDQIKEFLETGRKQALTDLNRRGETLPNALKNFRAQNPRYANMSEAELKDLFYEEYMADRYQEWKVNRKKPSTWMGKLFQKIDDFINITLFGDNLTRLFLDIEYGKYKQAEPAYNRFSGNVGVRSLFKLVPVGVKFNPEGAGLITEYLPSSRVESLANRIVAEVLDVRNKDDYASLSVDEVIIRVMREFTSETGDYNPDNPKYGDSVGNVPDPKKYGKTDQDLYDFLDQHKQAMTDTGAEIIKDLVREKYFKLKFGAYAGAYVEEQDIQDNLTKGDTPYDDTADQHGGFNQVNKELKLFIQTTLVPEDNKFNAGHWPLMRTVDGKKVYDGSVKIFQNSLTIDQMVNRLYNILHDPDTESQTKTEMKAFWSKFQSTVGLEFGEVEENGVRSYSIDPSKEGVFYMTMTQFQLFSVDYTFFLQDLKSRRSQAITSTKQDVEGRQLATWGEKFWGIRESFHGNKEAISRLAGRLKDAAKIIEAKKVHSREDLLLKVEEVKKAAASIGMVLTDEYVRFVLYKSKFDNLPDPEFKNHVLTYDTAMSYEPEELSKLFGAAAKIILKTKDESGLPDLYNKDDSIEYEAEEEDIRFRLRKVAQDNAVFDETVAAPSFMAADGKKRYGLQRPTFNMVTSVMMKDQFNVWIENDPYKQLNYLSTIDGFQDILKRTKLTRIDGMREHTLYVDKKTGEVKAASNQNKEGSTFKDFHKRDMDIYMLTAFLNQKAHKTPDGKTVITAPYVLDVMESASTSDMRELPVQNLFDGKATETFKEALYQEVLREAKKIMRVREEMNQIDEFKNVTLAQDPSARPPVPIQKGYNDPADHTTAKPVTGMRLNEVMKPFVKHFPQDIQDLFKDAADRAQTFDLVAALEERKDAVKDAMASAFEDDILPANLKRLEAQGIIKYNKGTKKTEAFYSAKMIDKRYQGQLEKNQKEVFVSKDLKVNVGNFYANHFLSTYAYNQMMLGDMSRGFQKYSAIPKRAKGKNSAKPGMESPDFPTLRYMVYREPRNAAGTQIDDAQTYARLAVFKQQMRKEGKLQLPAIKEGDVWLTVEDLLDRLDAGTPLTFAESQALNRVGALPNSQKYSGFDMNQTYIKTSTTFLTRAEVSRLDENGNWIPKKGKEGLHHRLEMMERHGAHITGPESAFKLALTNLVPVEALDGAPTFDYMVNELDARFFGLQMENPSNKTTIKDPTTMLQLLDKELPGRAKGLGTAFQELLSARTQLVYDQIQNYLRDPKTMEFDTATFRRRTVNMLKQQGAGDQIIQFFDDPDLYELDMPNLVGKFQQYVTDIFNKGVAHKVPGFKMTLESGAGHRVITELDEQGNETGKIITQEQYDKDPAKYETSRYGTRELKLVEKDGVYYAEAIIAHHFSYLIQEDGTIPAEYADMVGLRIPSSDIHSAIVIQVVDVLPPWKGSNIVLPDALIDIIGHDFDVDAFYVHRKGFYRDMNGKVRVYGDPNNPDSEYRQFREYHASTPLIKDEMLELKEKDQEFQDLRASLRKLDELDPTTEDYDINLRAVRARHYAKMEQLTDQALAAFNLPTNEEQFVSYKQNHAVNGEINPGVINNKLLDVKVQVLQLEELREAMKTPESVAPFENGGTRIARLFYGEDPETGTAGIPDLPNSSTSGTDIIIPFTPDYIADAFYANTSGKKSIGAAVNMSTVFAVAEKFGINPKLRSETSLKGMYTLSIDGQELNTYSDALAKFLEPGETAYRRKADDFSTMVVTSADNPTYDFISKFNLPINEMGTAAALLLRGAGIYRTQLITFSEAVTLFSERTQDSALTDEDGSGARQVARNIGKRFRAVETVLNKYKEQEGLKGSKAETTIFGRYDATLEKANATLGRTYPTKSGDTNNLLRRNVAQVENSEAVFAIGKLDRNKDKVTVNGGTGWAVQMALDAGKVAYVFDSNAGKWAKLTDNSWDNLEILDEAPVLTNSYAGIGTRKIDDAGKKAIADVIEATKNAGIDPKSLTMHSGGATGSDAVWDTESAKFGVETRKHYYIGLKTPLGNTRITDTNFEKSGKTASGNVILKKWNDLKQATEVFTEEGIISTRIKGTNQHFGNPFSSNKKAIAKGAKLFYVNTTAEAVGRYKNWILTGEVGFPEGSNTPKLSDLEEQRKWILSQIESGELKGKPIIYYTELGERSHANALDELINDGDLSDQKLDDIIEGEEGQDYQLTTEDLEVAARYKRMALAENFFSEKDGKLVPNAPIEDIERYLKTNKTVLQLWLEARKEGRILNTIGSRFLKINRGLAPEFGEVESYIEDLAKFGISYTIGQRNPITGRRNVTFVKTYDEADPKSTPLIDIMPMLQEGNTATNLKALIAHYHDSKDFMIVRTDGFARMMNMITDQIKPIGQTRNPQQTKRKMFRDLHSFAVMRAYTQLVGKDSVNIDLLRVDENTEKDLVSRIRKAKAEVEGFAENPLIKALYLNDEGVLAQVSFNTRVGGNEGFEQMFVNGFEELLMNPESRDIAHALFGYLVAKDALQVTNNSYIHYLPVQMYKKVSQATEIARNALNDPDFTSNDLSEIFGVADYAEFMDQFIKGFTYNKENELVVVSKNWKHTMPELSKGEKKVKKGYPIYIKPIGDFNEEYKTASGLTIPRLDINLFKQYGENSDAWKAAEAEVEASREAGVDLPFEDALKAQMEDALPWNMVKGRVFGSGVAVNFLDETESPTKRPAIEFRHTFKIDLTQYHDIAQKDMEAEGVDPDTIAKVMAEKRKKRPAMLMTLISIDDMPIEEVLRKRGGYIGSRATYVETKMVGSTKTPIKSLALGVNHYQAVSDVEGMVFKRKVKKRFNPYGMEGLDKMFLAQISQTIDAQAQMNIKAAEKPADSAEPGDMAGLNELGNELPPGLDPFTMMAERTLGSKKPGTHALGSYKDVHSSEMIKIGDMYYAVGETPTTGAGITVTEWNKKKADEDAAQKKKDNNCPPGQ